MSADTLRAHKRKPPKTAWKPGQSGNPKGGPKRGESWAEIIKRIGDMSPGEAAEKYGQVARELKNFPAGATLKELVVMRVYASMLFEPAPGLFGHLLDRVDGAVTQKLNATIGNDAILEWPDVAAAADDATPTPGTADDQD